MSDAVALYDGADQLKNEGKLEEAALKFKESIAVDPEYALPYSALAVVLQKLGQHDQAITHAQRVCELQPDDPFSYTAMSVPMQVRTIWSTSAWRRKPWKKAGCYRWAVNP